MSDGMVPTAICFLPESIVLGLTAMSLAAATTRSSIRRTEQATPQLQLKLRRARDAESDKVLECGTAPTQGSGIYLPFMTNR